MLYTELTDMVLFVMRGSLGQCDTDKTDRLSERLPRCAYLNDSSATCHGEAIARYVMAHEIINTMKRGFEAGVATRNVVKGITEKFHKPTGAITVSKTGQIGISFTTEKMAWAYQLRDDVHYGVDDYDHFSERIKI